MLSRTCLFDIILQHSTCSVSWGVAYLLLVPSLLNGILHPPACFLFPEQYSAVSCFISCFLNNTLQLLTCFLFLEQSAASCFVSCFLDDTLQSLTCFLLPNSIILPPGLFVSEEYPAASCFFLVSWAVVCIASGLCLFPKLYPADFCLYLVSWLFPVV